MKTREERFWSKVEKTDTCWNWTAATNDSGYGVFGWTSTRNDTKFEYAHRAVLLLAGTEIPEGLTVDHLCFNTVCVNPEHLRFLTSQENASNQRVDGDKYTCSQCGGPKKKMNSGRIRCPECSALYARRHRAKKKAESSK